MGLERGLLDGLLRGILGVETIAHLVRRVCRFASCCLTQDFPCSAFLGLL